MGNELRKAAALPADRREVILRKAFGLFIQKGPDNTTTTEIAKAAGVSVGTLYKYYPNKKALFLDMYEIYFFGIAAPSFDMLKTLDKPFALREFFEYVVDATVQGHDYASKHTHDIMMALIHNDEDYKRKDRECMLKLVDTLIPVLNQLGLSVSHAREKLHFILSALELYAHEVAYKETEGLEYEHIKETMIDFISNVVFT